MNTFIDWISKYLEPVIFVGLITSILNLFFSYKNSLGLEKNQRKVEIMTKSLSDFYVPMQKKYGELKAKQLNKKEASRFYMHVYISSEKNYIYVNPLVHKYLITLKKQLDTDKDYRFIINNIIEHINRETYRLRKVLGYPYLNHFDTLKIMDPFYTLTVILYILMILTFTIAYLLTALNGKIADYLYNTLSTIMAILFILSLIYLVFYVVYNVYKLFIIIRAFIMKLDKYKKTNRSAK